MFNFESSNIDQTMVKHTSIIESVTAMNTSIIENQLEIVSTVDAYKKLLADVFAGNNNIYDDDAKEVLRKSSLDILIKTKDGLNIVKTNVMELYSVIKCSLDNLINSTESIIEKYEPALKKVDTSKCAYNIPVYDMDKLQNNDMMKRVIEYLNTLKSLDPCMFDESPDSLSKINNEFSNIQEITNCIKRAILGVPKTMSVDTTFYGLMSSMICDKTVTETKSFGTNFYDKLQKLSDIDTYKINIDYIMSVLISELQKVSMWIDSILNGTNSYRDEFYDNIRAKVFASRSFVILTGIGFIGDVMQEKLRLANELNAMYINILVNTYDKSTSSKVLDTSMLESYSPSANEFENQILYPECIFCGVY